jgi:aminoglycoside phosphotransferase (APT) family kinase protein
MGLVDSATSIRKGEELDLTALRSYLSEELPDYGGQLEVQQFPSGYSNLTYLLRLGDKKLVLRRPPFGTKARSAHDMGREFRVLSGLRPLYPYCPEPVLYCQDESILGSEFYLMSCIEGLIVRRDYPEGLSLSAQQVRQQFFSLIDAMAQLHLVDYRAAGLAELGKPEGYVERQVRGWSKRYLAAMTSDAPGFDSTMAWLLEKMPGDSGHVGIIHNDFKLDNVIWDADDPLRLIGVLDWEMATLGDPLMDLGSTLGYWVQKDDPDFLLAGRLMPTNVEGAPSREEVVHRYSQATGYSMEHMDFYFCFGLFRLAVIAQQIYYRYYHGQTADRRFADCITWVRGLERMCQDLLERSGL